MHAIIGAGPMGLATARQLQRHGIPFVGFELHGDVGGLWDIDNPHSTMYESAHLISSKGTTQFDEVPMPAEVPHYPRHQQIGQYFRDYAERFGLRQHYQFNTKVVRVERLGQGWRLLSECAGVQREWQFDGVLIANGTLHTPNQPALPGPFAGELLHSSAYKSADVFVGKRVLVVGCGNSACDIAVDAVHRAVSVDLSVRRGYHFLPKFILGKPSQYGLPDPDYRLYESHSVMNSLVLHHIGHGDIQPRGDIQAVSGHRVTFADGSQADYDLILQATGYKLDYPFIDRTELNWPQGTGAPQLYLNVFHPRHKDLFMLGMVEASGLGWQGRAEQAELAALVIRQQLDGDASATRFHQQVQQRCGQRLDGGYAYLRLPRMAYYVHKDSYRAALQAHIAELKQHLSPTSPEESLDACRQS